MEIIRCNESFDQQNKHNIWNPIEKHKGLGPKHQQTTIERDKCNKSDYYKMVVDGPQLGALWTKKTNSKEKIGKHFLWRICETRVKKGWPSLWCHWARVVLSLRWVVGLVGWADMNIKT